MKLLALLLAVFALACGPSKPVTPPPPPVAVDLGELSDAYHANPVAADERYKGRILTVSGRIADIVDDGKYLFAELPTTHGNVLRCFFRDEAGRAAIAELRKGEAATLSGENAGFESRGGVIPLAGCKVIK